MENKITIIEGPPPTFEPSNDEWSSSLSDSPNLSDIAITKLRTFNGPALVERCHRAWREKMPIHLEYRAPDGLQQSSPIVAARSLDTEDGQILVLWVRLPNESVELEIGYEDDTSEDEDDFIF